MNIDSISLISLFIAGILSGIGIGRASLTRKIKRLEGTLNG